MADDKRISVYVGPPLAAVLDGFENRSGRLNSIAERYSAMVKDELRRMEFSRNEWCAIMDANNGAHMEIGGDSASYVMSWANIADSPETDEKWGVDHQVLAGRVRALGVAARIAVFEAIVRFWTYAQHPTDEALMMAGVNPKPHR
jgi:hypothetical protein